MTHTEQFRLAVGPDMVKVAFIGKLTGTALGKGLMQSGRGIARNFHKAVGYGEQALGKLTGNADRVTSGLNRVTSNMSPHVPGVTVQGSKWNPMNQARVLPQRFKNVGQRMSNWWGAGENGIQGFGGHAAYAAGRLPAALTYGGAATFLPYTIGDYAGSAHGAMNAKPNLQNHAYDEATKFFQNWENMSFGDRIQAARAPDQFGYGMLQSGDPTDQYSVNAYRRMYDPSFQNTGVWDGIQEAATRAMPIGPFLSPGQGDNSLDQGRNFIERAAARRMADEAKSMFTPKSASVMNNSNMLKAAFWQMLAKPALKQIGTAAGTAAGQAATRGTLSSLKYPALVGGGMLAAGYFGNKGHTEQDMYSQMRGTARAGMANYWQNMTPMQRYGAAIFPTAARMRAESQLGPGYRDFYNQYYGNQGTPQTMPQMQTRAPMNQGVVGPQ